MPDWEENGSYFAKYMDFSEILYFAKRLFGDIPISFRASTDKNVGALFFAPERISEMEKTVLSVCREVFKAKNPGERDREMWRVYLADHWGRVGSLYSSREVRPGEVVSVGLQERDGRLLPCIIWA